MGEPHFQDSKCFTVYGKWLWAFSLALPGSVLCRTTLGWCSTIAVFISSSRSPAPKLFGPIPFPSFYPCPLFLNEPSPLRTEIWGNVIEISAYEMGQAFATLKCHQMTLMVFTLWLDISNMVSSTVISFPGSPVIITMPIAINLMKIEKHGRSQFVHNFMTSIKPSYYKEHCFVTTRYH